MIIVISSVRKILLRHIYFFKKTLYLLQFTSSRLISQLLFLASLFFFILITKNKKPFFLPQTKELCLDWKQERANNIVRGLTVGISVFFQMSEAPLNRPHPCHFLSYLSILAFYLFWLYIFHSLSLFAPVQNCDNYPAICKTIVSPATA